MIALSYISFILWFLWRIYLTKDVKHFVFQFDGIHHGDAGWALVAHGLAVNNVIEVALGVFAVIDDSVGHWRAAHGKSEKWIIEWMFDWLYIIIWKWIHNGS